MVIFFLFIVTALKESTRIVKVRNVFCYFFIFWIKLYFKIFLSEASFITRINFTKSNFHEKSLFISFKVLFVSLISKCGRFLWFWLQRNVIIMLINNNMMLISDSLDNTALHKKFPADLVTFTEGICNGDLHFFCSMRHTKV